MSGLKIGIDAHALAAVGTGNQTYMRGLIEGLRQVDQENEYLLYGTSRVPGTEVATTGQNLHARQFRFHSTLARNLVMVPMAERSDRLDIFHAQFFLPLGLHCRTVVSIHDLCYEHYPEFFSVSDRIMLPRLVRASAERANRILTLSEFSKRDIAERYAITPDKIEVVQPGIEPHFRPIEDLAVLGEIRGQYALPESYILFFGRTDPRKGVDTLIKAYQNLSADGGVKHQLIIAGRAGSADKELRAMVRTGGLERQVRFIGIVPDSDLPGLISGADFCVYPSIFEGFGLPALEAMACGKPMITTNASSLPEVVQDGALMFEPGNVGELVRAMKRLLDSDVLAREAGAAALVRAQNFSWVRSASQVRHVYETIMTERNLN